MTINLANLGVGKVMPIPEVFFLKSQHLALQYIYVMGQAYTFLPIIERCYSMGQQQLYLFNVKI